MAAALGHPSCDPHGDPIPAADGSISDLEGIPLTAMSAGDNCTLSRVSEADPERLRYLGSLGLRPGLRFAVVDVAPFDGPVTIETAFGQRVIGHALATGLLCTREEVP
jgi:DtxR family Mn-dependent transcriptional regulator